MKKSTKLWRNLLLYGIPLLLTLVWVGFIFGNSLKDGEASTEQSQQVQQVVNDVAESVGVEEPISEQWIRDAAHFFEFLVLSLLLCWDLLVLVSIRLDRTRFGSYLWCLCAVPLSAFFALVDEGIQRFSAGRASQLADVLLDTAGALLGAALFFGVLCLGWAIRKKRERAVR